MAKRMGADMLYGLLHDALAAGSGDGAGEAACFCAENRGSEIGEPVVSAALVVGEACFFDEAAAHHAVDGTVERAGAHGEAASAVFGYGLHDGVAVLFAVGEGEQDGEDGGGEREVLVRRAHVTDISVTDVSVKVVGKRRGILFAKSAKRMGRAAVAVQRGIVDDGVVGDWWQDWDISVTKRVKGRF